MIVDAQLLGSSNGCRDAPLEEDIIEVTSKMKFKIPKPYKDQKS